MQKRAFQKCVVTYVFIPKAVCARKSFLKKEHFRGTLCRTLSCNAFAERRSIQYPYPARRKTACKDKLKKMPAIMPAFICAKKARSTKMLRASHGCGIGIRTPTNRVRVCRATVTQFRNASVFQPTPTLYTNRFHLSTAFSRFFGDFLGDARKNHLRRGCLSSSRMTILCKNKSFMQSRLKYRMNKYIISYSVYDESIRERRCNIEFF